MGKSIPLVGVFMPAYNQGKYIDEALASLKRQTLQDFVVHIVDDGSTDGTAEKLKTIKYEKAKVFLSDENKGVAYRARVHYKKLKTKYILVLCADDYLAPEFLEKTVAYMEQHPKCGIVSTNFVEVKNGKEIAGQLDESKMTLPHMLTRCNCLGSSLMRKAALEEADLGGGFTRYQDWDRYVSMMEKGWTAGLVKEPLFYYRQHGDSLSHSVSIEDEMEVKRKMLKKHKKMYEKYYETVILDLQYNYLELLEGKKWLESQYERNLELEAAAEKRFVRRVCRKIKKMRGVKNGK